ncbi:MAG: 4a-hydroxytetrahydrobiopterin dehydratase [Bacteroidetes bacterium]|nr:4a-hydroxytetrahydrobiopterin dehydratase [Bacteroidota bacterium]MDA0875127.1 4a-hydroxytetrahydrobiopterin dehydratase [Bacteroidota bacterium]
MHALNRQPLSDDVIRQALSGLPGWSLEGDTLERTFQFASFREAMSFMVRVAFEAEDQDHHPEWTNVYNRVRVVLSTHDAGNKVTELDLELARRINHLSWI